MNDNTLIASWLCSRNMSNGLFTSVGRVRSVFYSIYFGTRRSEFLKLRLANFTLAIIIINLFKFF